MPKSAQLNFREIDLSFTVEPSQKGIVAVSMQTLRGPFGHDGEIMRTWEQFRKKYGGEIVGKDGPTLAKRAFERGAQLRVNRMGHYTNASDAATLDAVVGTITDSLPAAAFAVDGTDDLFNLTLKYAGADYNNVTVHIEAASNGNANSFNLRFAHANDSSLDELYENLIISGTPTDAASDYLKVVQERSNLFDVVYEDLSALTGPLRPTNGSWNIEDGDDGTAPADADYVGNSAGGTGFHAFAAYDDFFIITSLDKYTSAVHVAGSAYSTLRKDCVYFAHIPTTNDAASEIVSARAAYSIDSSYVAFFSGGIEILDNRVGAAAYIPEIGDVIGAAAYTQSAPEYGPWWSFAGPQRGLIYNALGVQNNFGSSGQQVDLNAIANAGVNMVINRGGRIMIWGNFTGQLALSKKSFLSIRFLSLEIKKSLTPVLETFIEDPNDIATWGLIYQSVKPYLDGLASSQKRALFEYAWNGDQFASNLQSLVVNNATDVALGKYKVNLYLKEINSLQDFEINIISTPAGISFDDNI